MSAYAPRTERFSKYGPYAVHIEDGNSHPSPLALDPGERLGGRPKRRRRGRALLNLAVSIAMIAGGGWAWINHQATIEEWSATIASAVSPLLSRNLPTAPSQPPPQETASLPPLETREAPPATIVPSSAVALPTPDPAAQNDQGGDDDATKPVEKLPPVVADPSDPFQVRALAAGLHPGLSRALLTRLSDADYRNAEIAIRKALAETPDAKVFEYPKKRTPELALFQVKFVRGISPDCRRYVVMVTKDHWLTTAMPMEKCGIKLKEARK